MRSDSTHFRCGSFSLNDSRASSGVVIYVRQGLPPKQSCLPHAEVSPSLWQRYSSKHQSFLDLHLFPSIWKSSSIIFIHKIRKHLDSLAFFQPISFIFCVSKFESITLSRLLFSGVCDLSPTSRFSPRLSTLLQILYFIFIFIPVLHRVEK